jgi:hypothetical protein
VKKPVGIVMTKLVGNTLKSFWLLKLKKVPKLSKHFQLFHHKTLILFLFHKKTIVAKKFYNSNVLSGS